MWDPVHMYNAVVNDWKDVEPQMTFDVRQPATREYSLKRLRRFLETHEYVDVVRFTTFFHQFTLIFDEMAEKICGLVRIFCISKSLYLGTV